MFGLFASQEKKMREHAANWLELARKVWHFRRDALTESEAEELRQARDHLSGAVAARADAGKLKLAIEGLEGVLRRTGGAIYPKTSLVENVEFFLVAAIVILGLRTYFLQPFKIPTNSMWPSYYGMTGENLPPGAPAPGLAEGLFRLVAYGAQRRTMVAPRTGQVEVPFFARTGQIAYTVKSGRSWLVFPTDVKEYTFFVDGAPTTLDVPVDFSGFDELFMATYFPRREDFARQVQRAAQAGPGVEILQRLSEKGEDFAPVRRIPIGRTVRAGEPVMRFDLMTGDQLFVDRISYQFMRPEVGQGFVFRTDHIPMIGQDQYFIKRLVGRPGDRIEIRAPVLWRNGAPITGARAFALNAERSGLYRGYTNATREDYRYSYLFKGESVTIPPHAYLALGDNSPDSLDGRFWGFVPAKDVVGRPLAIYYPFTRRWGFAR
jgi:signal peptidase I